MWKGKTIDNWNAGIGGRGNTNAPRALILRGVYSIRIGSDQQRWRAVCAGENEVSTPMNIPEILDCLDEPDLEDWLTAAFIENESQLPLDRLCTDGAYPFPSRTPDIWMLEIIHRTGKSWKGRFYVEFSKVNRNGPEKETTVESQTARLFFTLDTETAEVAFEFASSMLDEQAG
jgi:hypothetical protein